MPATPVDIDDVSRRASTALTHRFPSAQISQLEQLTGGASSLTYRASLDSGAPIDTAVVKVAPPGLDPVRNRDVLRQSRLLAALHEHPGVGVPEIYGTDPGDPPEVPPLFAMSYVEGESYEPLRSDGAGAPTADELVARTNAAAAMLAALQTPELPASFPDEPVMALTDEIDKWSKALATVDPAWVPGLDVTESALRAEVPEPADPVVLHGDWRLGNMQCVAGDVRAVIDWEIWSIGDPRLDLAWFCMMMDRDHPGVMHDRPDTPTPSAIVGMYERASGQVVDDFGWFMALTAFKQSATSALIVKHATKRGEFGPAEQRRVKLVRDLLDWARALLG